MGLVYAAHPTYCVVKIERDKLYWGGDELLPPEVVDLGGISGGPVFSIHDGQLTLVGIIQEGSAQFDLIYVANLASLPPLLP